MESQYWNDEVQQSAWLLDYDRRCMLDCADTFQNLAAVMGEMNWELEQEKTPDDREELLRRRQAMESRKQYAARTGVPSVRTDSAYPFSETTKMPVDSS